MTLLLSIIIGMATGWVVYLFVQTVEREALRAKWFATLKIIQKEGSTLAWNRPLIPLTTFLFKREIFKNHFFVLENLLRVSGLKEILEPPQILSWSLWMLIEVSLIFCLLFGFSFGVGFVGAIVGMLYPWLWIFLKKKERIQSIRKDLPLVMDLLAVSVSAGLDMMQALQKVVKLLPPTELLKEFEEVLQDLKLGRTRKESLMLLKTRLPLMEIRNFVSLLLQAVQLGSPLAPVLLASADQMRTTRMIQAERLGVQASQKILFPLIFCILPAVFLTLFAPLLLRYFTGGFENLL